MVNCQFEPLSYLLLNGLPNLAFEEWIEVEKPRTQRPYGPDWEAYQRMEDRNSLRFISMREDENLIGYASIVLDNEVHDTGFLMGTFRDIYVTKPKRGYAAKLVRFVEKQLSEIGVVRLVAGERVEANLDSGAFYEAMGFVLKEKIYWKDIN